MHKSGLEGSNELFIQGGVRVLRCMCVLNSQKPRESEYCFISLCTRKNMIMWKKYEAMFCQYSYIVGNFYLKGLFNSLKNFSDVGWLQVKSKFVNP